ncbi:hypothetical protein P9112_009121 [Eukaryota sp. TZLM1-RC]
MLDHLCATFESTCSSFLASHFDSNSVPAVQFSGWRSISKSNDHTSHNNTRQRPDVNSSKSSKRFAVPNKREVIFHNPSCSSSSVKRPPYWPSLCVTLADKVRASLETILVSYLNESILCHENYLNIISHTNRLEENVSMADYDVFLEEVVGSQFKVLAQKSKEKVLLEQKIEDLEKSLKITKQELNFSENLLTLTRGAQDDAFSEFLTVTKSSFPLFFSYLKTLDLNSPLRFYFAFFNNFNNDFPVTERKKIAKNIANRFRNGLCSSYFTEMPTEIIETYQNFSQCEYNLVENNEHSQILKEWFKATVKVYNKLKELTDLEVKISELRLNFSENSKDHSQLQTTLETLQSNLMGNILSNYQSKVVEADALQTSKRDQLEIYKSYQNLVNFLSKNSSYLGLTIDQHSRISFSFLDVFSCFISNFLLNSLVLSPLVKEELGESLWNLFVDPIINDLEHDGHDVTFMIFDLLGIRFPLNSFSTIVNLVASLISNKNSFFLLNSFQNLVDFYQIFDTTPVLIIAKDPLNLYLNKENGDSKELIQIIPNSSLDNLNVHLNCVIFSVNDSPTYAEIFAYFSHVFGEFFKEFCNGSLLKFSRSGDTLTKIRKFLLSHSNGKSVPTLEELCVSSIPNFDSFDTPLPSNFNNLLIFISNLVCESIYYFENSFSTFVLSLNFVEKHIISNLEKNSTKIELFPLKFSNVCSSILTDLLSLVLISISGENSSQIIGLRKSFLLDLCLKISSCQKVPISDLLYVFEPETKSKKQSIDPYQGLLSSRSSATVTSFKSESRTSPTKRNKSILSTFPLPTDFKRLPSWLNDSLWMRVSILGNTVGLSGISREVFSNIWEDFFSKFSSCQTFHWDLQVPLNFTHSFYKFLLFLALDPSLFPSLIEPFCAELLGIGVGSLRNLIVRVSNISSIFDLLSFSHCFDPLLIGTNFGNLSNANLSQWFLTNSLKISLDASKIQAKNSLLLDQSAILNFSNIGGNHFNLDFSLFNSLIVDFSALNYDNFSLFCECYYFLDAELTPYSLPWVLALLWAFKSKHFMDCNPFFLKILLQTLQSKPSYDKTNTKLESFSLPLSFVNVLRQIVAILDNLLYDSSSIDLHNMYSKFLANFEQFPKSKIELSLDLVTDFNEVFCSNEVLDFNPFLHTKRLYSLPH